MSVPPGASIPPLPISKNLDADFVNSLTNTIVIYDDDDERTANIKENVAGAKNQILDMIKQGRSVSDVLKEYQDTVNEHASLRSEAQIELRNLSETSSPEEAKAYLDKVNKALKSLGLEPVSLPPSRAAK